MSVFTYDSVDLFAPVDAAGAARQVNNGQAQVFGKELQRIVDAAVSGVDLLIYTTKTALDADLAHAANTAAIVIGDSVANDGLYAKSGASGAGSWTRVGDVPGQSFVRATNAGAGTANAIQATTVFPLNENQLVALPIVADNTASPVTIAFDGGSPLTIKTSAGNDVATGGLASGMIVAGYVSGATFRLLSDQASAAILAAAEAAQVAAEAAQAAAEAAAATIDYLTVADRAALLAVDPVDHSLVYLTEESREGYYEWDGSDLSGTLLGSAIASSAVDAGTDTVTSAAHNLNTANPVVVTSAVNGLAINTRYYVIVVDDDNFKIASSVANAIAGTPVFDLTASDPMTVYRHLDATQETYITAATSNTGADGAWVKKAAVPTGSGWTSQTTRASFQRVERILAGEGATAWDGRTVAQGGRGGWLLEEHTNYLLSNAQIAGVATADGSRNAYGVLGASISDVGYAAGIIGATGLAHIGGVRGWAGYFEAVKRSGAGSSSGSAFGIEIDVTNQESAAAGDLNPYAAAAGGGQLTALWIASGGGEAGAYDANTAIAIGANPAKFNRGLVFLDVGLVKDGSSFMKAIQMSRKMMLEWYEPGTSTVGGQFYFDVSDAAHKQVLAVADAGLSLYNTGGKRLAWFQWVSSAVNAPTFIPAATGNPVVFSASGDDTNIDIRFLPKGTGVMRFGTHTAIGAETVTGYITIKDSSGASRKIAVVS